MDFEYKHRGTDGQLQTGWINAKDRSAALKELSARGIKTISLAPCKCGRTESSFGNVRRLIPIAVVGLIAIGIVGWFLAKPSDNRKDSLPAPKTPVRKVAPPVRAEPRQKAKPTEVLPISTNSIVVVPDIPAEKKPGTLPLPDGRVLRFHPPRPGETNRVYTHGAVYEVDSEGNFRNVTPPRTFDNRFENVMEGMSVVGKGVLPAAALSIKKEEIALFLAKKIDIRPEDSEEVVAKKIATAEMKESLKSYLKEGGTWEGFVAEIAQIQRTERMMNAQTLKEISGYLKQGDVEGARQFHEKASELMSSKGFRGIKLPPAWAEALDNAAK